MYRLPCAKGEVNEVDRGIVLFYNPSVMAAPCHHPRVCCAAPYRGGFYKGLLRSPYEGEA